MKSLLAGFIVVATLVLAFAAWMAVQYKSFLQTSLTLPEAGYALLVEPGTPAGALIGRLADEGFTRTGWQWKVLMRLHPPEIQAGEFELKGPMTPRELLDFLSDGSVIHYPFTIVEGWTFSQLIDQLGGNAVLIKTDGPGAETGWGQLIPGAEFDHPEGWFLPETYLFVRGDRDIDILARAHRAMRAALDEAWAARDLGLPLNSPYELLVLASIIEKETAIDSERNQIAGVFIRRLQKGMRLQTDPTVIYGLGEQFDGDIRRRDLRTDTPYNTYTRFGLPPTPIALPGRASLMAAGQPDNGDTLFFVADGKGGHTFSRTLEEHQKAVDKLIGKP